jgi:hypothetical protein
LRSAGDSRRNDLAVYIIVFILREVRKDQLPADRGSQRPPRPHRVHLLRAALAGSLVKIVTRLRGFVDRARP